MQIMPRGVLSYLHADFLKFKCNNKDFVEYYFVVSKLHISCKRGNASRRWSHLKVQTDADKNDLSRVRRATETDISDVRNVCFRRVADARLIVFCPRVRLHLGVAPAARRISAFA